MTAIRTDLDQKGEMWEPEIEPGLLRNKEKDSRPLTGQGRREENDPLYAGGGGECKEGKLANLGRDLCGTILRRVFPTSSDPPFSCVSFNPNILKIVLLAKSCE